MVQNTFHVAESLSLISDAGKESPLKEINCVGPCCLAHLKGFFFVTLCGSYEQFNSSTMFLNMSS